MSTENGIEEHKRVQRNINIILDRLQYLQDKQAERIDDRLNPSHYLDMEIRALEWALPILEAERDALLRLTLAIRAEAKVEGPAARRERSLAKSARKVARRVE